MLAPGLHPLTLRFASANVEAAFGAHYVRRSVRLVRASLAIGLAQVVLFGVLDRAMVPEAVHTLWLIRAGPCAAVALVIGYTFAPAFRRTMQAATTISPLVVGLGIVWMAVIAQEANGYYGYYSGVMIVLIYAHVLLRLRFVVATAVGVVLSVGYLAASVAAGTPGSVLLNGVFYLVSTNLAGMVASYALELYARRAWAAARQRERTNAELATALDDLKAAQAQVLRAEKLAGLGRLTSGVAHELKNPLNFVNNFAGLSVELGEEAEALLADPTAERVAEAHALLGDLRQNAAKILEHGRRADAVVAGMREHTGALRHAPLPTDLNALVEAQVAAERAAFHARYGGWTCALSSSLDPAVGTVAVEPQEMARVVATLVNNALYAVRERATGDGQGRGAVAVRTRRRGGEVTIEVADDGVGIPDEVRERLFEPFFTTKPPGDGVGLGLSRAYEAVTAGHGGTIRVEGVAGGTQFVVTLPAPPAEGSAA